MHYSVLAQIFFVKLDFGEEIQGKRLMCQNKFLNYLSREFEVLKITKPPNFGKILASLCNWVVVTRLLSDEGSLRPPPASMQ